MKCSKFNHFARCCPGKTKSVKNVKCDSRDSDDSDAPDSTFFVGPGASMLTPLLKGKHRLTLSIVKEKPVHPLRKMSQMNLQF